LQRNDIGVSGLSTWLRETLDRAMPPVSGVTSPNASLSCLQEGPVQTFVVHV